MADLVIVVAKTDAEAGSHGFSLLVVERGMPGFDRGRRLKKVGMKAQDTAELSFTDVRVPAANVLGEIGSGLIYLFQNLAQERLSIAVGSTAGAEAAVAMTLQYTKERKAFGRRVIDFQNSRFALAEMSTEVSVTRAFVDRCISEHVAGGSCPSTTPPRPSGGPATCSSASSTVACNCTVDTGTCWSTRSPAPTSTPACSRSSGAPTRS